MVVVYKLYPTPQAGKYLLAPKIGHRNLVKIYQTTGIFP